MQADGVETPLAAMPERSWKTRSRSTNERSVGRQARPAATVFGWKQSRGPDGVER